MDKKNLDEKRVDGTTTRRYGVGVNFLRPTV